MVKKQGLAGVRLLLLDGYQFLVFHSVCRLFYLHATARKTYVYKNTQ